MVPVAVLVAVPAVQAADVSAATAAASQGWDRKRANKEGLGQAAHLGSLVKRKTFLTTGSKGDVNKETDSRKKTRKEGKIKKTRMEFFLKGFFSSNNI